MANAVDNNNGISVYQPNPHYFKGMDGKPVFFIGYYDMGLHRRESLDYYTFLDKHSSNKINYVRIASDPWVNPGELHPYLFKNGKFDLGTFDESYWTRMSDFIAYAKAKGVYVHVMLWSQLPIKKGDNNAWNWMGSAWNIDNNINPEIGDLDRNNDGGATGTDEFFDYNSLIHNTDDPERLTLANYQKAYVDKLINTIKKYDNVFISTGNELTADPDWIRYWVNYIKSNDPHLLITVNQNFTSFDSLNEPNVDGATYHSGILTRGNLEAKGYSSSNYYSNRFIGIDTDGSSQADWQINAVNNRKGAWTALVNGVHWLNYINFDIEGYNLKKARYFKYIQDFIYNIPFWEMSPHNELASSGQVLADPSREFVIYLVSGGTTTVNLSTINGALYVEWYNPRDGTYHNKNTIQGGTSRKFKSPDTNDWVLHISANYSSHDINLDEKVDINDLMSFLARVLCYDEFLRKENK